MNTEELLRSGFLKRISPSLERAKKSLEVSQKYLLEAKKGFGIGVYEMSIIGAYSSIFHAARAILFRDGIAERSHSAVYDYLKEKHPGLGINQINSFNLYRGLRHSVAYGLDTVVGEDDAKGILNFAEQFLSNVKKYLKL